MPGINPIEPVASQIKPVQGMSLSDMVNMARGVQAYQQAEQVNPLVARKAAAEANTAEIGTQKSQLELDQSHFNLAGNILSGLESRAQALAKKGDAATALKELESAQSWIAASGLPIKKGDVFTTAKEQLKNGDFNGYLATLENQRNILGGAAARYEANLPQITSNAAQQPILVNKMQGTVSPVAEAGRNVAPTAADVSLGSEYAKNLQVRSQAANDWLQRSTEMRGILDEFKAGAGSTTYAQIAQKLQAIGAPDDLVNKVGNGDLSATQSLQKFMASSIMSAARQSAEGSPFASEVKNFEANNPSVNSDPKTLKRFIDFYDRIAGASLKENEAMAQAKEQGLYNPGTWQADWQRIAQKEGILPKTPSSKANESSKQQKTIVREGTYNGKPVVQYSDGTIGYK